MMNGISPVQAMLRRAAAGHTDNSDRLCAGLFGSSSNDESRKQRTGHVAKSLALLIGVSAMSAQAAERNWYAGIEAGRSDIYNPSVSGISSSSDSSDAKGHSNAWGLNVGYRINAYFALEYGYRRIFDGNLSTLDPKVSTHDVSLLAYTPEFRRISAFARLGVSRMHDDGGASFVLPDRDSTEAHFGLGANWRASERVNLRIERIEYANTYWSRGHVLQFGLGFSF